MEQALKDKGVDPGAADGVMGPRTAVALKAYQKSENLPTTGTVDGDAGAKLGVKVSTRDASRPRATVSSRGGGLACSGLPQQHLEGLEALFQKG